MRRNFALQRGGDSLEKGARVGHSRRLATPDFSAVLETKMGADGDGFSIHDSEAQRALKARLSELREEHRALDSAIDALSGAAGGDALQVARLKKRKLQLKDQIIWCENQLTPDIIA